MCRSCCPSSQAPQRMIRWAVRASMRAPGCTSECPRQFRCVVHAAQTAAHIWHAPSGGAQARISADPLCSQPALLLLLQGALLTAVEALKLFFIDAAARGQLPAARLRKVRLSIAKANAQPRAATTAEHTQRGMQSWGSQDGAARAGNGEDAAAQHAAWLARQLAAFEQRLLGLLAGPSAVLQVGRPANSNLQATSAFIGTTGCAGAPLPQLQLRTRLSHGVQSSPTTLLAAAGCCKP
jgi:hypothetical protein